METKLITKKSILATVLMAVLVGNTQAKTVIPLIKEQPHNIYHVVKNKTLQETANQLANRSGITFKINPVVENDMINRKLAGDNWNAVLAQLLQGYNYTAVSDQGAVKTVVITGRNGSGQGNPAPPAESELLVVAPDFSKKIPERYKNFKVGSVMSVKLPMSELANIPVGNDLILDLPIGQYKVKHDNLVAHDDGSSTWIGYLDEEGKGYRVYLSQGDAGVIGNVYTPDGVYNIETVDGQTVVVNLDQSGLQSAGYERDQANSANAGYAARNSKVRKTTGTSGSTSTATATGTAATSAAGTVVDLMVLYTTVNQTADYAKQRIKYLVDVSNQAYKDSGIDMSLRLVHTRGTNYVENNANSQALSDLANDIGAFAGTAALRDEYGADLVALFRPLYAKIAGSCGTAYVGFVNGSGANPELAYGAIGDGYSKDASTNYYCGTNTFAHEIGHNLGNVHDREYSNAEGKFPYSYAWGIGNQFGTIMSYYGPSVMLFSTPLLATQCAGTPCGFPEGDAKASDQTRTINYTAPFVSGYRATMMSVPVIQ